MIEAADIVAMLSEQVSKRDTYQPKGNKRIQELIEYLYETIQTFLSTSSFEIYDESRLDQIDSSDDFSGNESQESEDNQGLESEEEIENNEEQMDSTEEEENDDKQQTRKFSLDYMKQVLDYYDEVDQNGKRKHSWKNPSWIKTKKVHEIDSYVFTMFKDARDQSLCIYDADLQRWAIAKAREQSMYEFVASNFWVYNFKHKHSIVSRKISKVISSQSIRNADEIDSTAEDFVNAARAEMKNYSSSEIFNTDQVNLVKEFRSNRTLTFKGEKITAGSVTSKNASTHSYTIQPLINMEGKVVGPLFLCLQETTGRISEDIQSRMFQADNVIVTCSKSGKLTSSHVSYWVDQVLIPNTSEKSLLLSDSWSGQNDGRIYRKVK
ncbi:unnamed protein product, partial [Rotaria sp. Silwood2]